LTDILKRSKLFSGMDESQISSVLKCTKSHIKTYPKGDFIFLADVSAPEISILLSGSAQIIKENIIGDSMIVGSLEAGDMFGETFACTGKEFIPVTVIATDNCEVIFIDADNIIQTSKSACEFHRQMISNLLRIIAEKNVLLNKKMSYITHKTIRGRLEAYFLDMIEQKKSFNFTIPYNRNELADYLCADRSALCRELTNMRKEGIINYAGNNFQWLKKKNHID
jgi:CRP-like cAMP-binding protein